MEGDDGADEGGRVDDEHLVVGIDVDRLDKVGVGQVGQQVEDVLQLVGDLVVHGQLPVDDLGVRDSIDEIMASGLVNKSFEF